MWNDSALVSSVKARCCDVADSHWIHLLPGRRWRDDWHPCGCLDPELAGTEPLGLPPDPRLSPSYFLLRLDLRWSGGVKYGCEKSNVGQTRETKGMSQDPQNRRGRARPRPHLSALASRGDFGGLFHAPSTLDRPPGQLMHPRPSGQEAVNRLSNVSHR